MYSLGTCSLLVNWEWIKLLIFKRYSQRKSSSNKCFVVLFTFKLPAHYTRPFGFHRCMVSIFGHYFRCSHNNYHSYQALSASYRYKFNKSEQSLKYFLIWFFFRKQFAEQKSSLSWSIAVHQMFHFKAFRYLAKIFGLKNQIRWWLKFREKNVAYFCFRCPRWLDR